MRYVMNMSRTDGRIHEVHHDNCLIRPFIMDQTIIGRFNSDKEAMRASKQLYSDADGCRMCMPKEYHE